GRRRRTMFSRDWSSDVGSSDLSTSELNWGDYNVFLSTPELRSSIEAFRTLVSTSLNDAGYPFSGMVVTSAFRNPVHHHVHTRARSEERRVGEGRRSRGRAERCE